MADIKINDRTVTIERLSTAKMKRVLALLSLIEEQMPDITARMASFRARYRSEYAIELDRINAVANIPSLRDLPDEEWEKAGQKIRIPQEPSGPEMFVSIAPAVYEAAEEVVMRLLGLLIMPNDVVHRYIKQDAIWDRVDELVDETLMTAPFDELMDLIDAALEILDKNIFSRITRTMDRAGKVMRGTTTSSDPEDSGMSSAPREKQRPHTSGRSQSDTDGSPTPSEISIGTTVSDSSTQTQSSATVS